MKILLVIIVNLLFLMAAQIIASYIPIIGFTSIGFEFIFWALLLFLVVPYIFRMPKKYEKYKLYLDGIHLTSQSPFVFSLICTIGCYALFVGSQLIGSLIHGMYVFDIQSIIPPLSYHIINPNPGIFEEMMFRGVILALLLNVHKKKSSIIISSLIFGLVHFANLINGVESWQILNTFAQVGWAFGMGILWAILTIETNSIIPGIVLHYLSNAFDRLWLYVPDTFEINLLYKVIFSKAIPIILSILFIKFVSYLFKRRDTSNPL